MMRPSTGNDQTEILDAALQLMRLGVNGGNPPMSNVVGESLLQIIDFARDQLILWPVCQGLIKTVQGAPREQAIDLIAKSIIADIDRQATQTRDQLVELIEALAAGGISPVFLKGAAFIAEEGMQPQPWRPMCDLDFLIGPHEVDQVVAIAKTLGYEPVHTRYSEKYDVHFPMLLRPPDVVGLEAHIKLTWADLPDFFSPAAFRENSRCIEYGNGEVLIPSDMHRLAHLILHAQISGRRYDRYEFVLRELLDWHHLSHRRTVNLENLERAFMNAGYGNHYLSFAAFCDQFWNPGRGVSGEADRRLTDQWRANAMRALVDQRFHGRALLLSWLRIIARALLSPSETARLARSLMHARRPHQIREVFHALIGQ